MFRHPDKVAHAIVGAAIAGLLPLMGVNPLAALCAALTAGIAKEFLDHLGTGTPDVLDTVATASGAFTAAAVYFSWSNVLHG